MEGLLARGCFLCSTCRPLLKENVGLLEKDRAEEGFHLGVKGSQQNEAAGVGGNAERPRGCKQPEGRDTSPLFRGTALKSGASPRSPSKCS